MIKTILTVLMAAAPAGAAEFGLEKKVAADLLEVAVMEAPAPRLEKSSSLLSAGEPDNRWKVSALANRSGFSPTGERAGRSGFRSAGFYQDLEQAGQAMLAAVKELKRAGADVLAAEVGAGWTGAYYYEVLFISEHELSSHTGAAYFSDEKEAGESLRQMAALLADGDRAIIAAELTRDDRGFSYVITALEGAAAPGWED